MPSASPIPVSWRAKSLTGVKLTLLWLVYSDWLVVWVMMWQAWHVMFWKICPPRAVEGVSDFGPPSGGEPKLRAVALCAAAVPGSVMNRHPKITIAATSASLPKRNRFIFTRRPVGREVNGQTLD